MSVFKPCSKCDHSKDHLLPDGYILTRDGSAIECECHKKWKKQCRIEKFLLHANLPQECLKVDCDISKQYNALNSKKLLYFYGTNGTGKTTTAASLLVKFCKENAKSIAYTNMQELSSKLFSLDANDNVYFDDIRLLAIDECFDAEKIRLYSNAKLNQISQIELFLRRRLQNEEQKTILISNVLPTDISKTFTASCQDFICREIEQYGVLFVFNDKQVDYSSLNDAAKDITKEKTRSIINGLI